MTRNDFENVATMLASNYADLAGREYLSETTRDFMASQLDRVVYGFARLGVLNNRRFDAARFMRAAGMREDLVSDYAALVERDASQFFGPFKDGSGMVMGAS